MTRLVFFPAVESIVRTDFAFGFRVLLGSPARPGLDLKPACESTPGKFVWGVWSLPLNDILDGPIRDRAKVHPLVRFSGGYPAMYSAMYPTHASQFVCSILCLLPVDDVLGGKILDWAKAQPLV